VDSKKPAQSKVTRTFKPTGSPVIAPTTAPTEYPIDYEALHLNKTLLDQVHCSKPEQCPEQKIFGKFSIRSTSMIDVNRKILMEFTAKAGCTYAVSMFLDEIGFHLKTHYDLFPHTFRIDYYFHRCGMATPCMYTDPSWYRFKVVRNPYDRAVSSYIHICRSPSIAGEIIDPANLGTLSFRMFLDILLNFSPEVMDYLANEHAAYQASAYERHVYFHNQKHPNERIQLFHHIVKLETVDEDLEKYVNPATASHYAPSFKGNHLAPRHNSTHYFVGDTPWSQLKKNIPEDYGLFYNTHLKDLVTKIYFWDIVMYNYTFPFIIPN
jgi:hypothetical protein